MEQEKNSIITSTGIFKYYDNIPELIVEGKNFEKTFYGEEAKKLFEILIGVKTIKDSDR